MSRTQPPSIPRLILDHLTPPERDEALAGDLLEEFRSGRTNGWFWRQALWAWAGRGRGTWRGGRCCCLCCLWSALAPAWTAVIDCIEQAARTAANRLDTPLSALPTLMLWLSLRFLFLWVGTVVYFTGFVRSRRPGSVLRACCIAAGLFLPAYFATFILMNLFAWPGLEIDHSSMTPLREIADVRIWAMAIRAPYLVTMLCAMWRSVPRLAPIPRQRAAFGDDVEAGELAGAGSELGATRGAAA